MKKNYLLTLIAFFTTVNSFIYSQTGSACGDTDKCTYQISMIDNGGAIFQIRQNGIVVKSIGPCTSANTLTNVDVPLCSNIPFELYWSSAGTSPQNSRVYITNPFTDIIYDKLPGTGTPSTLLYSTSAICTPPTCPKPSEVYNGVTTPTTIPVYWTEAGKATQWEVCAIPLGGQVPINGEPINPSRIANTNPFTVTGLLPSTTYNLYVRAICSATNISTWKQSGLNYPIITKPTNDELANPMSIPVNPTMSPDLYVSGDTNGAGSSGTIYNTCEGSNSDIWYSFVATSSTHIISIKKISGSDIYHTLNIGTSNQAYPNNLIHLYCSRDLTSTATNLIPGTTYKIRVYTFSYASYLDSSKFTISVTTPAKSNNDDCLNAIQIPNGQIVSGSTAGSTMSAPNTSTCLANVNDDVWFNFVATSSNHTLKFTDIIGRYAPNIYNYWEYSKTLYYAVYSGNDCSTLTQVYCGNTNDSPFITILKNLIPGNNYKIRVFTDGTIANKPTTFSISILTSSPELINDNCSGAIPISFKNSADTTACLTSTSTGATASDNVNSCIGTADDDVWFNFVATATTHVISLNNITGDTDLNHTLYSGNDCGTMAQLYCSNPNTSVATNLIPGNTYKIRVYTNAQTNLSNPQTTTFDICINTPPPITNDNCDTAITLLVNNDLLYTQSKAGTLTTASASTQPNTCIGQADDDVWYKFVATSTTHYITLNNIVGSTTDLNHSVYTGNCNALTLKYCGATNTLKSTAADFVTGETYYVRVWSNSPIAQNVDFNIYIGSAQPPVMASTTVYTTEQLVKNILINNPCISVSNITSSTGTNFSSVNGLGYFSNPKKNSEFPITSGVVLSTGNALSISGPNSTLLSEGAPTWPGDTQLESLMSAGTGQAMNSKNASSLEFDFTSMNEFMSFNFLFASEEYGAYQCSFADAFAFLLTDKTTNIITNLAVIPGTTLPVSIVTIRDKTFNSGCPSQNPAYFGSYYGTDGKGLDPLTAPTNFNGISKLMTASSAIIPNHPYHIKLVIADRQDTAYDTAVFIEGGSFTSGAPECMDHIKLAAYNDTNGNGVKDTGESNFTYGSFIIKKNKTGDATTISSVNGSYNLFDNDPANKYDFSFQINPEYAPYYSVAATNFNQINIPAGSGTNTLYFPVTVKQAYKDVSVTVIPVSEPVPGATFVNKVVYKNSGTIAASGTISFTKPAVATITLISQSGTVETTNGFTYDFTALAPGETRTFDVTMSIPTTVNVGDVLTSVASISANVSKSVFGGIVTSANSQTVVTSQASTTLSESHTEKIPYSSFTANDYLTYTIRFQNTGSANATSVRIEDVLNDKLDLQSLTMINASHNYVMERVGNKIVWKLDYINLVGAPQSDALSRGYLTFKIKMLPGFAAGTIVPNKADLYFDSNDAVSTHNLNTEFVADQLWTPSFESQNILLFPNPTSDIVQVRLQNSIEILDSIVIYDLLGKVVQKVTRINADQSQISVGDLAKGVYLVEITTEESIQIYTEIDYQIKSIKCLTKAARKDSLYCLGY